MPARKRALSESTSNVGPPAKNTRQGVRSVSGEGQENQEPKNKAQESNDELTPEEKRREDMKSKLSTDYICIGHPYWCGPREDDSDDEAEDREGLQGDIFLKPASDHPEHKWVITWKSWTMLTDWIRRAKYTDPDLFNMYIYNDFHWYGLAELLENLLADFSAAKKKQDLGGDKASLYDVWAPMACLAHWINMEDPSSFIMMDDGDRCRKLIDLIGCAALTMLETFGAGQEDYGCDDEDVEWRSYLIAYAEQAGIDLEATGCSDIAGMVKRQEDGPVDLDEVEVKKDRWGWEKKLKAYTKRNCVGGKLGGEHYNILKMSREERAAHSFDKKDALAHWSAKDLRKGKLDIVFGGN